MKKNRGINLSDVSFKEGEPRPEPVKMPDPVMPSSVPPKPKKKWEPKVGGQRKDFSQFMDLRVFTLHGHETWRSFVGSDESWEIQKKNIKPKITAMKHYKIDRLTGEIKLYESPK